ncbi:isoprenoid synthase domain-containing protein [Roridomyces roridus]|uniref:(2E,6E)-farnesyl diphosphate synthase n=1 Tax=Roridomyces roridus TaxID=1738132 RepID=A0AAD7BHB0_9AGAR|nr:isoprenoid synthase domain-containing protein [Roridomyces roridus]
MSASAYDNILSRLSSESPWSHQSESAVLEPFTYIISNPGKDIRSQLMAAFNTWINVPEDKLKIIAKVISMLHNASLMVDDIQDDSLLRRGAPVAHKIYGVPQTINTANYVYFLAFQELLALASDASSPSQEELISIITTGLISLHRGQGLELLWRDSLTCPTEEEYVGMVNNKTGGLIRIGIKLLMACGTTNLDVDYVPLANLIGVFFQIRDDYMNLKSGEYTSNKGFAEDLTEGKFSFPIVHGIHADRSNRQVLNTLQKRPKTPTLKIHTISYLDNHTQSFAYTRSVLKNLEQQMRDEITRLGGNKRLETIIDGLALKDLQ